MPFASELRSLEQHRPLSQSDPGALCALQRWVATARSVGDNELLVAGQCELARCLLSLNRIKEAIEASAKACMLAEAVIDLRVLHHALIFHALLMDQTGCPNDALSLVERALSLDCALEPQDMASAQGICGKLRCRLGRVEEGLQALRASIVVPGLHPTHRAFRHLALIRQLADDLDRPGEALQEWHALQGCLGEQSQTGQLQTALMATELSVNGYAFTAHSTQAMCESLLASHAVHPHSATGWGLGLALDVLVRAPQIDLAQRLVDRVQQQSVELLGPDLHRWTEASKALVVQRSEELAAHVSSDGFQGDSMANLATRSHSVRHLAMQLPKTQCRLGRAGSRKSSRRIKPEMPRGENERLHGAAALPLLDELARSRGPASDGGHNPGLLGFHLVYQPFFDLSTDSVMGAEVLLRLNHPELGPLTPAEFIPRLDLCGEIKEVGRWVITEACSQLHRIQARYPAQVLAVNVSVVQLEVSGLADHVAGQLRAHSLHPSGLELEITETMSSVDSGIIADELERLRRLGVSVSIDDFGTGYSNFARLLDLQPNKIKLDRSLMNRLSADLRSQQALGALIEAAHVMGVSVTAEGVESVEQLRVLKQLKCDFAQGYLLSRPVNQESFVKLLDMSIEHRRCLWERRN